MKQLLTITLPIAMRLPALAFAEEVNVETIVPAESDQIIRANMAAFGRNDEVARSST